MKTLKAVLLFSGFTIALVSMLIAWKDGPRCSPTNSGSIAYVLNCQ